MRDRKMMFGLILFILLISLCACNQNAGGSSRSTVLCKVNFNLVVDNYINANIRTYGIQYRAIPLFGDYQTPGRSDNYKTVSDDNGAFSINGLEKGDWVFYIRIVDSGDVLQEIVTGTVAVVDGLTIDLGEAPEFEGYGKLGIYIRADRVAETQVLRVVAENINTGTKFDFSEVPWSITEKGTSYIDYAYFTTVPAGNYMVRISAINDEDVEAMSTEEAVVVKATLDGVLTVRLRAQKFEDPSLEIGGVGRYLEGIVTGPIKGTVGEEVYFEYVPLNDYTEENAVWYWWYLDDRRISSRDPLISYKFSTPGLYLISCVPVGINGEIPADGSSYLQFAVGMAEE